MGGRWVWRGYRVGIGWVGGIVDDDCSAYVKCVRVIVIVRAVCVRAWARVWSALRVCMCETTRAGGGDDNDDDDDEVLII